MADRILAMVRKDLQLFFSDRRAVIMGFVAPIAIASFFGSIFSAERERRSRRRSRSRSSTRTAAPISKAIVAGAAGGQDAARSPAARRRRATRCKRGRSRVAVVIPAGSAMRPAARSSAAATSRSCDVVRPVARARNWAWCAAS